MVTIEPDAGRLPGATGSGEGTAAAVLPPGAVPSHIVPPSRHRGLLRRFLAIHRHLGGLALGALVAAAARARSEHRRGLRARVLRALGWLLRPCLARELRHLSFARQLRRRLELLGPTYVKFGQILAIREDLLPAEICRELQVLFDHVPPVPFALVRAVIERELCRPLERSFAFVEEVPIGSASLAQAHYAITPAGQRVVLKVMKPGMRELVERDLALLQLLARLLQLVLPRYQPRQIIQEFSAYTRREVDFTFEADNIEMFAGNFRDMPGVVFPRPYRQLSTADVLTMDYLEGYRPGAEETAALPEEERSHLIDLGAAAIIRMLYQDGFFHADLHAGNLLILPGEPCRIGFIDLGMVGRFEERTKRRMLYYYHALVTGDVDGAAKFLTDMATLGRGADPEGFRRAVADLSRRFYTRAARGEFSIAQLILESVGLGGRYRMFFPVEMTLMVKALVTFEGVGRILDPHLDVTALSRRHITRIFRGHMNPAALARELLRGMPELLDVAVELPRVLSSGVALLQDATARRAPRDPFPGIRGAVLAAACLMGGVLSVVTHGPLALSVVLFVLAVLFTFVSR